MNEVAPVEKGQKAELVAGNRVAPIVPRTIDEVFRVAEAVYTAGLAPDSYKLGPNKTNLPAKEVASRIMVGVMKGAEIGLAPITAINYIAIINGRPSLWGDGASALIQNSGKLEWQKRYFTGSENEDDWTAHVEMKRVDQEEVYTGSFSVKDAKRAHLWANPKKKPWMEYPQRQLMWRAFSWPARDGFADVLSGLSIAEEARDMPPMVPEVVDKGFLDDAPEPVEAAMYIDSRQQTLPPGEVLYEEPPQDAPTEPQEPATEPDSVSQGIEASLRACVSVENIDAFWASVEQQHSPHLFRIYQNLRAKLEAGGDPEPPLLMP